MTKFERNLLIEDCREACRTNVMRTDEEHGKVRKRAERACQKLGIEFPEDVL